ncbi:YlmH/Sll1252 family protein [Lactobacillus sp. R2/2]|nr:YlmH/Sll1252 family protein [Lactobacillus sp. R2/2]MEB3364411.1 YlmH/Sll1252 family protein [Lactobacillus sp. R2/2]
MTHSDVLGSIANAGIETSTFGDIITDGNGRWQFFGKSELTDFFQYEITHIGHTKVKLRPISSEKILAVEDESKHLTVIASSLRLDAVLAAIAKQSRNQIKDNIKNNLVKLNWHTIKDFNIIIEEDNVLSLRHFGRCKIMGISTTKRAIIRWYISYGRRKKEKQKLTR